VTSRIPRQSTSKVRDPCFYARHSHFLIAFIVIAADPDNDDVKRDLAEVYEILGETRKALNLVNQGV
jgi:hypothetical protein